MGVKVIFGGPHTLTKVGEPIIYGVGDDLMDFTVPKKPWKVKRNEEIGKYLDIALSQRNRGEHGPSERIWKSQRNQKSQEEFLKIQIAALLKTWI